MEFAKVIADYLFDSYYAYPKIYYHVDGIRYEPSWDDFSQGPSETKVYVDYDDEATIKKYTNLRINKLR